jgi:hypothetical protein
MPAPKKGAKGKTARSSKASRASVQSTATTDFDIRSVSDAPAEHEDSVMTTTSVMTQASKKGAKGRKAATTKGRKTRAKKDETIEIQEDDDSQETETQVPAQSKPTRGKKRNSDEMEDSVIINAEAPAPKKRATRARTSNAADSSVLTHSQADVEVAQPPPAAKTPAGRKKGRVASGKRPRKGSAASIASTASTASLRGKVVDDDELDRQLEADLDRRVSNAKDETATVTTTAANGKGKRVPSRKAAATPKDVNSDFAMFDPTPIETDDAVLDAELKAMKTEVITQQPAEEIQVPKKGRKAGTRKASKQTKKGKDAAASEPEAVPEPATLPEPEVAVQEDHDMSTASAATVVRGTAPVAAAAKRARGRPPKKSDEAKAETVGAPAPIAAPSVAMDIDEVEESTTIQHTFSATARLSPNKVVLASSPAATPKAQASRPLPQPLRAHHGNLAAPPPSTPRASPAQSAKQAAISPSPSPQSSDAENQPPSSKPSARRPPPLTPSAHRCPAPPANVIGGLRSTLPWSAVDLEAVFAEDAEDAGAASLARGGQLSTPERAMTVEEWVFHNAGRAEQKLRVECEAMVSRFEREGGRALRVLEGLVVD